MNQNRSHASLNSATDSVKRTNSKLPATEYESGVRVDTRSPVRIRNAHQSSTHNTGLTVHEDQSPSPSPTRNLRYGSSGGDRRNYSPSSNININSNTSPESRNRFRSSFNVYGSNMHLSAFRDRLNNQSPSGSPRAGDSSFKLHGAHNVHPTVTN